MLVKETLSVHRIHYTMMTEDDILDSKEQDHLRMNVSPDQTIILGLQIFLDHRSSRTIDQRSGSLPMQVCPATTESDYIGESYPISLQNCLNVVTVEERSNIPSLHYSLLIQTYN